MQQVKKQLQDAIAELKSGWGINEVKREDLAAVLEKVVAALDRAAQLPVAPVKTDLEGGVIVAVKKYSDEENFMIENLSAPSDSILTLYGSRGSDSPQLLMFSPHNRKMYTFTDKANSVEYEYRNHVILCGDSIVTFEHDDNGHPSGIRSFVSNVYFH